MLGDTPKPPPWRDWVDPPGPFRAGEGENVVEHVATRGVRGGVDDRYHRDENRSGAEDHNQVDGMRGVAGVRLQTGEEQSEMGVQPREAKPTPEPIEREGIRW